MIFEFEVVAPYLNLIRKCQIKLKNIITLDKWYNFVSINHYNLTINSCNLQSYIHFEDNELMTGYYEKKKIFDIDYTVTIPSF